MIYFGVSILFEYLMLDILVTPDNPEEVVLNIVTCGKVPTLT